MRSEASTRSTTFHDGEHQPPEPSYWMPTGNTAKLSQLKNTIYKDFVQLKIVDL